MKRKKEGYKRGERGGANVGKEGYKRGEEGCVGMAGMPYPPKIVLYI